MKLKENQRPEGSKGLYSPDYEHDGCGVGLVVKIDGSKHHSIVDQGLSVLEHMAHRGAEGADNKTGDGAGIMVQIPHEYILLNGIPVPEKGRYGGGMVFLPKNEADRKIFETIIDKEIKAQGLFLMHTRPVPVDSSVLGHDALITEPEIRQIFIVGCDNRERLEGLLYVIRKRVEQAVLDSEEIVDKDSCYIVSLSTRTLIYKGMLSSLQLRHYFKDLQSPYFTSAIALVHSRFSTNTFPTWRLAQPFRLIGHNGEINTIRGNRFWMQTREAVISPDNLGEMKHIGQVIQPGMSDSASFDNALEFFVRSGIACPTLWLCSCRKAATTRILFPASFSLSMNTIQYSWLPGTARRQSFSPTADMPEVCSTATACVPPVCSSPRAGRWSWPPKRASSTLIPPT